MKVIKAIRALDIDAIVPGTAVARDVCDAGGRVLVPAGATLSESLLQALARRGIPQVEVEIEEAIDPAVLEARVRQIETDLDNRFRLAGEGSETRQLRQAVHDFLVESAA